MKPAKNIIERLAAEILASSLAARFDICTCQLCRNAMIKHMLERIPTEANIPANDDIDDIADIRARYEVPLSIACMQAIEDVEAKPPHTVKEETTQGFEQLLKKIRTIRNIDLRYYHTQLLKNRFAVRINACKLSSYTDYIECLDSNPKEYAALFSSLGLDQAEFFRDPPVCVTLRYLLETVAQRKQRSGQRQIRIWSAGCGTGEEAFTLAILAHETIGRIAPGLEVQIYGTDIDPVCLASCEKGEYPHAHMLNVDKTLLDRYFIPRKDIYKTGEDLRRLITFRHHDLLTDDPVPDTDLIACRNVLIYFNKLTRMKLLLKFHQSLVPPGFLLLGKGEPLPQEADAEFEEIDSSARISRKR